MRENHGFSLFSIRKPKGFLIDEIKPRGDRDLLFEFAKRYDADLLLYGHTHTQDVWERDGIVFVNPGSATGVSRNFYDKPHCAIIEIKAGKISVKKS